MISFVIPAYNEELLIDRTLVALRSATEAIDEAVEIIVVNDGSTDRTREIALGHGVQVLDVSNRQIAATRNAGARAARGDILIFVDADTSVTEEVVKAAISAIRQGAVGGGCSIRFDGPVRMYAKFFERFIFPVAFPLLGLAGGCFFFCSREAFLDSGGFDETRYWAEEVVMAAQLKRRGRFVILREHVITSGRKVRTYSAFGLLKVGIQIVRGNASAKDFWYRREPKDP